jgi:hypothetical protein
MPILGVVASSTRQGQGPTDTGSMFPISSVTLTSTASTVTFSSIPQTYTHLQLRVLNAQISATHGARLWFNGDTTNTNYWVHALQCNGSSASASNGNANSALYYSGTTSG